MFRTPGRQTDCLPTDFRIKLTSAFPLFNLQEGERRFQEAIARKKIRLDRYFCKVFKSDIIQCSYIFRFFLKTETQTSIVFWTKAQVLEVFLSEKEMYNPVTVCMSGTQLMLTTKNSFDALLIILSVCTCCEELR